MIRPTCMAAAYDVFLSYAWADGDRPQQIFEALTKAGLRVWFDMAEINDFTSITRAVSEGLAKSKALLAYYSQMYPQRRACQWELTAAFLAAQADSDPRRRVLVVNPEANADHIHPIELRDAKFRVASTSNGPALHDLVQSVVKHVSALEGPLGDIHPLSAPNWYGMAPVGSTHFVGRLKEMWNVQSLLCAGDVAQVSYATAATGGIGRISGLAGIGKSLLAEEYALHFGSAYPGGVFWLRAHGNDDTKTAVTLEQREALRTDQMREIAERLGIDTRVIKEEQQVEGALARKIASEGKRCLWVVDDVPSGLDGQALRRWFAPHALARTLITTRSREYESLTKGFVLSVLAPYEAYQLLTSRRAPADLDEEDQARLLAEDLGYHALALDVTASALMPWAASRPFADFRAKLVRPDKNALELAERLADALPNGHQKSIAQTILHSVLGLGPEGQDFLRLASILAVAPIPGSLVSAVFQHADKLCQEDAMERATLAFKQVTAASLSEIAGVHEDTRVVHTLVSRTVRFHERGSPERTKALRAAAVVALGAEIAAATGDPNLHEHVELEMAHARQTVGTPATADDVRLTSWMGRYEFEHGSYASARKLQEETLKIQRRVLGPEHPDTLTSMSNLAATLLAQGNLSAARKLQKKTLKIQRRVLGPEHHDTLSSMNSLAETLHAQGDLSSAHKLQTKTLRIQRRVLGPEHPDTLTLINNLAETLRNQGDLSGARKLQEGTLDAHIRVLGPWHARTLSLISNLAETLHAQGDLSEARKLQQETLDNRRRVLGPEHPDTLTSMNNLAETLHKQGDLVGARKLQEEALESSRRILGPEHPHTCVVAWNLLRTLVKLRDHTAALAVVDRDLLWLLGRDAAALTADQRTVGLHLAEFVRAIRNTGVWTRNE